MLSRTINRVVNLILERFPPPHNFSSVPCAVFQTQHGPLLTNKFDLNDLLDGWLWATPKRRTNARQKWREKYGDDNWKYGQKLYKPKRNITTCAECGSFHEFHTICRTCFDKVHEESTKIIESIRNAWGRGVIDKEVQVVYEGETAPDTSNKRVVEMERPRPLWFAPNLSQLTANPRREISGPASESVDHVVKVKEDEKTSA